MDPATTGKTRARARRLIATANELLALARELEFEHQAEHERTAGRSSRCEWGDHPTLEFIARQIYHHRRRRGEFFDSKLFGEPAWDMLLDLYIAAKEGKRVSVTSACIAADAPSTTALRWIGVLEKEGLVVRENDEADARRIFIALTADCYARMARYLGGAMPGHDPEE